MFATSAHIIARNRATFSRRSSSSLQARPLLDRSASGPVSGGVVGLHYVISAGIKWKGITSSANVRCVTSPCTVYGVVRSIVCAAGSRAAIAIVACRCRADGRERCRSPHAKKRHRRNQAAVPHPISEHRNCESLPGVDLIASRAYTACERLVLSSR